MNIHDSLNLGSKTSLRKAWNAARSLSSYYRSKHQSQYIPPPLPVSIAFEPTTSCNLRCPECPSGLRSFTRPTGILDKDFFQSQINQLQTHVIYLTFYFQGEPFLHPHFLDMVRYASERNLYTATSTNAHYLHEAKAEATVRSGLDRLIISIDGVSQDTYERYRVGGRLDQVLQGVANLVKWKRKLNTRTPHLIFQFLVFRTNEHQLKDAKALARKIGVDEIQFKTAQIYDFEQGSDLIPNNSKYTRYVEDTPGNYRLKHAMPNRCWKMWHSCVITWDGRVVPCCFDKDAQHVMGNLHEAPLSQIWNNAKYHHFRKMLLAQRTSIDICKNCSES